MPQLIQMRQRLKAIGTIKKITHAMRLISMSTHTRLKAQEEFLNSYRQELNSLFGQMASITPQWRSTLLNPDETVAPRSLVILIGSQKGLCGNFNATLFNFFSYQVKNIPFEKREIIAIGRKAVEYVKQEHGQVVAVYHEFKSSNLATIAHEIAQTISTAEQPYTTVTLFSNQPDGFFRQKPSRVELIPFDPLYVRTLAHDTAGRRQVEDYVWEQDQHKLLDHLAKLYMSVNLRTHLFNSLLAEQAARFISMDSSTRNAETMLDDFKLQYNKVRQAKITKELTELASSFQLHE